MNADLSRYLRLKALAEYYEGLDENERRLFLQTMGADKREICPTNVDCRDPYWRGVSQNVVGDAIYDLGIRVLKRLLRGIV